MSQTLIADSSQMLIDEKTSVRDEHERLEAVQTKGADHILPAQADPEPDRKIVPVWISADPTVNAPQGCTKCATRSSSH